MLFSIYARQRDGPGVEGGSAVRFFTLLAPVPEGGIFAIR